MALNFSHRPIFPVQLPEDNIVRGGCQEEDIHDILPADPFGMDISSTVTAITGWLEDLAVSEYGGCQGGEVDINKGQHPIFAGWNFWWDTAEFQPFLGKEKDDTFFRRKQGDVGKEMLGCFVGADSDYLDCWSTGDIIFDCTYGEYYGNKFDQVSKKMVKTVLRDNYGGFVLQDMLGQFFDCGSSYDCGTMEEEVGEVFCYGDFSVNGNVNANGQEFGGLGIDSNGDDGSPHPALSFALAYLGVSDLLNVERVCKSLQATVQSDPLLWNSINIDHPLNERISDEALIQLTKRAQGHLQCLSLVECKITEDCLKHILESNPKLTKLCLPGCSKLSIDGVVSSLKSFQQGAIRGLKYLRLGGVGALWKETSEHLECFEVLSSILGIHNKLKPIDYKPRFYHQGNPYLCDEDDRPLDVEICSKCQKLRLVYDCPAESCEASEQGEQLCRACILCIPRCEKCGRCVNDVVYVENFFLELQCSYCSQDLRCQDEYDIGGASTDPVLSELDG